MTIYRLRDRTRPSNVWRMILLTQRMSHTPVMSVEDNGTRDCSQRFDDDDGDDHHHPSGNSRSLWPSSENESSCLLTPVHQVIRREFEPRGRSSQQSSGLPYNVCGRFSAVSTQRLCCPKAV
ncbi:hypothetical protein JOB18_013794 [Solea senegalensis]|uniref:Uncharacterized protein n=1 Tax=Solea senegalensis TaxID=28829 RepID=A0AAV6T589_SOLSE|nr:hypothetical protein JOB18_013794 [Solea senegalensis]